MQLKRLRNGNAIRKKFIIKQIYVQQYIMLYNISLKYICINDKQYLYVLVYIYIWYMCTLLDINYNYVLISKQYVDKYN